MKNAHFARRLLIDECGTIVILLYVKKVSKIHNFMSFCHCGSIQSLIMALSVSLTKRIKFHHSFFASHQKKVSFFKFSFFLNG